ncbi:ABC transporter substrate-binding protein [Ornithinibacillus sp. 4-3]|uniref:ABC transporter substrate-binding protein n=1 Tax=Ornithinibacillus sp. 4-3 TaxID=3231488 RepID=A0AB39HQB1_9BACI
MVVSRFKSVLGLLIMMLVLAACQSTENESNQANGEDTGSGESEELRVSISIQPPTLDPPMSTATKTSHVARNIFETLVTLNAEYQPVPMLADTIDQSDDRLTYTFHLREGVLFHNGKEMVAEDVVASMNRWLDISAGGKLLEGAVFEEGDPYTVLLKLETPIADVLEIMADHVQFPAIMPKEIVDTAEASGVTEYIGTGPFQFKEWRQDQYIHLEKFEDYVAVDAPADGFSGKKEAFINNVYFMIVPDPSTTFAGLQTGEFDIVYDVSNDQYEQLLQDEALSTRPYHFGSLILSYNKKEGPATDQKFRHALNAAINSDDIMQAGFVHEDLFEIDSGYMTKDRTNWYSDNGSEFYNQADPEKAKQLLEESDYNGEPITLLTSRDYEFIYNASVVLQEQLEQVGINVELELYDWPTVLEMRQDPELWDLHINGTATPVTPSSLLFLNYDWVGWPEHPKIDELLAGIKDAVDQEEAKSHWDELQEFAWADYLPISILGQYSNVIVTTDKVVDFSEFEGGFLWNTKLVE